MYLNKIFSTAAIVYLAPAKTIEEPVSISAIARDLPEPVSINAPAKKKIAEPVSINAIA